MGERSRGRRAAEGRTRLPAARAPLEKGALALVLPARRGTAGEKRSSSMAVAEQNSDQGDSRRVPCHGCCAVEAVGHGRQRARREVEAPWGGGEQSCLLQPWEENLPAAKRREEGDSAEAGLRKGGAGRKGAAMRCERLLELRRRHGRSTAPWWLLLP
jgi:hypothetical protein